LITSISERDGVDVPTTCAAAAQAVALVRTGEARMLMKGSLHTDVLMHEVVSPVAPCGLTGGSVTST
jgi:hypothetical protein